MAQTTTAAETFWGIEELRYELFQWDFPKKDLVGMMVLEKKSLPEVAKALYRVVDNVEIVKYLEERGCSKERIAIYAHAVMQIEGTVPGEALNIYSKQALLPMINIRLIRMAFPGERGKHAYTIIRDTDGGWVQLGTDVYVWQAGILLDGYRRYATFNDIPFRTDTLAVELCIRSVAGESRPIAFKAEDYPFTSQLRLLSLQPTLLGDQATFADPQPDTALLQIRPERFSHLQEVIFRISASPKLLHHFRLCPSLQYLVTASPLQPGTQPLLEFLEYLGQVEGFHRLCGIAFTLTSTRKPAPMPTAEMLQAVGVAVEAAVPSLSRLYVRFQAESKDTDISVSKMQVEAFLRACFGSGWSLDFSPGDAGRPPTLKLVKQVVRGGESLSPSVADTPGWRLLSASTNPREES